MNSVEMSVGIVHKMYQCRKAAKLLLGNKYKVSIDLYIQTLRDTMTNNGLNEIESVLKVTEDPKIKENEMAVIMLMAAAIEISEE